MYGGKLLCTMVACLPWCAMAQQNPAGRAPPSLEERMQRMEQRQQELEEELKRKDAEIQQLKTSPAKPAGGSAAVPNPPPRAVARRFPPTRCRRPMWRANQTRKRGYHRSKPRP